MPKISVILPIYNVAPYLEETFESLIHQSIDDIEIIAVNDGSIDDSEEIIKRYQKRDNRIIALSQANKGQSAARNLALQHASGQYIYMMDSDDILTNANALQTCYDYAEKNNAYRVLRPHKNRFGPVEETGIFEMTSAGGATQYDVG